MFRAIRDRIQRRLHHTRTRLVNPDAAERTVQQLEEDGVLSPEQAAMLRSVLPRQIAESHYVLGHFGAHLGICVAFAFNVLPLPLGTIARVVWVLGSRVTETFRRRPEHARVHSTRVLFMSMVPWLGYSAYLIPLRSQYGELAFILANQIWLTKTGNTFEKSLLTKGPRQQRMRRWLIPCPASLAPPPEIIPQPS